MEKIYELLIIGGGPAGLTAGIYATRAQLDTLIIEKNGMSGGQIITTYEVDNYPGLPGLSGFDLAEKLHSHCEQLGGKFETGEVVSFELEGKIKKITLTDGRVLRSKTVIIASGAVNRHLDVPGEEELQGMGVSYCATCDGAFFKNRTTVVVGGGDVAIEDAIFLSRLCKEVYVIHRREEFRAAKSLIKRLQELDNVTPILDTTVQKIIGDDLVEGVVVRNEKTQEVSTLACDGVFVAVGTKPNSEVYQDVIQLDEYGYIIADETGKTNVDGVFAAGDIRTKALRQIITAASDGANAVTAVEQYLIHLEK